MWSSRRTQKNARPVSRVCAVRSTKDLQAQDKERKRQEGSAQAQRSSWDEGNGGAVLESSGSVAEGTSRDSVRLRRSTEAGAREDAFLRAVRHRTEAISQNGAGGAKADAEDASVDAGTFPARYRLVLLCTTAFVICNMDKVNMSVAILPMAAEYGWSASVAGLIQSAFFWGYMLAQIPAGYLANRHSGRRLLPGGVAAWSAFTAAVPMLSGSIATLCVSRAAVGGGEGVAPSAVNDIVARCVPANERARSISTIFGGLHVGSILGLLAAPPLIGHYGWQGVFYVFGGLGLVWVLVYEQVLSGEGSEVARVRSQLMPMRATAAAPRRGVPYRAFLRNGAVRALMFTHFCNNWFHYTMLAWLPTYFTQTLSLDIAHASTVSLFPSIAGVVVSSAAGQVADRLIEGGMEVGQVRRLAQCTAFLLPAACLAAAGFAQGSQLSILFISGALGLNSFALAGLYCTHQDMSAEFAGPLLGLTNTSGAVPGIVGVVTVGFLLDMTESWQLALFAPIIALFFLGTACYALGASSERQDFSDNTPFLFEQKLALLWSKDKSA